jgi:hypothetical protein
MRLAELFEGRIRRRADRELQTGHEEAVEVLKKVPKSNLKYYGVSMTNLPKVGINPKSTYNTPLGIYCYPASYYLKIKGSSSLGTLEFQDNAPYIQIIDIMSEDILDISDMTEEEAKEYVQKLIALGPQIAKLTGSYAPHIKGEILRFWEESSYEAKVSAPGGKFWYVLWSLTGVASNNHRATVRGPVVWNKILRMLGIDAIIDDQGIIHENEPYQLVIFDPRYINHVATIRNRQGVVKSLSSVANNSLKSLEYALTKKKRFIPGETAIASDPKTALKYAKEIIKGKWPAGEAAISTSPEHLKRYQAFLRDKEAGAEHI